MRPARRALVVTIVHHPDDARIRQRQIPALVEAGWQVTYAAPWRGYELALPADTDAIAHVDVRRAEGRRRLSSYREARRLLKMYGPGHDVVLLHDPELVPVSATVSLPPVVWDVHEDTPATVMIRHWVPSWLRGAVKGFAVHLERWAESHVHLLLADRHYAARFRGAHPVVPNAAELPPVPVPAGRPDPSGRLRVVYLGSITIERGACELISLGRRLREVAPDRLSLEVVGPAHGRAQPLMEAAEREGVLTWRGFLAAPEAQARLTGALAGLCPLHDEANFRPSMPTKVVEYLAHGVPVITTPLPLAAELVERSSAGLVVPFGDVEQTLAQVLRWADDPTEAARTGVRGREVVRQERDWSLHSRGFVAAMERFAGPQGA